MYEHTLDLIGDYWRSRIGFDAGSGPRFGKTFQRCARCTTSLYDIVASVCVCVYVCARARAHMHTCIYFALERPTNIMDRCFRNKIGTINSDKLVPLSHFTRAQFRNFRDVYSSVTSAVTLVNPP